MKKQIQLWAMLLCLLSCKPAELRYMDNLGRKIVVHTDSTTVRAELQAEGLLILPKIEQTYYWFEKGKINSTQGAYSGKVLHGQYRVYDSESKRPLVSGKLNRGLKTGRWLNWTATGILKQSELYQDGLLNGPMVRYDSLGKPADTLKYKHGQLVLKRIQIDSAGLFSKIKRFLKLSK